MTALFVLDVIEGVLLGVLAGIVLVLVGASAIGLGLGVCDELRDWRTRRNDRRHAEMMRRRFGARERMMLRNENDKRRAGER